MTIRIGTAGWNVSSRYAEVMPVDGSHLARYARRLNAVEINSSFYRPHQRKTYERWAGSTPGDFRFAVKIPKEITHEHRLADCEELLDRFAAEVNGLGEKLGILLVQLPPTLGFDRRVAGRFILDLRKHIATDVALEPRHPSWFAPDVSHWLAEHRIARVAADPSRVTGADRPAGWSGVSYYRWHGSPKIYYSDYDADALVSLERRLEVDAASNIPVWCIFDNTAAGAALGNALAVMSRLERDRFP